MVGTSKKIISIKELASTINDLPVVTKIVLAGGCFDILHEGHIAFLTASKKRGDILALLLESDERIRKLKGINRPVNSQLNRARVLAHLPFVDYIILLPQEMTNNMYDQLILAIKPAIITTTAGDPYRTHKERQAALVGGEVVTVTKRLTHVSTTKFAEQIHRYE